MTASDLHDRIVSSLARKHGGTKRRWRIAVGDIRVYSAATHPHCNWSVEPTGTASENDAVQRLLDELRLRHPLVAEA